MIFLVIGSSSDTCGNSGANTCTIAQLFGSVVVIRFRTNPPYGCWVIHNKCAERRTCVGAVAFEFLTYQLWAVGYWPTVALTGNGELGFDSGEGA